jgi:hypothetical protein
MTQAVFPEVQAATAALEQRITMTESEIAQMKESITETFIPSFSDILG